MLFFYYDYFVPMKLYDAHTHLNTSDLFSQRQDYLDQFVQAGGAGLVNSWANDEYNLRGIQIAQELETLKQWITKLPSDFIIKSTLGYHPGCCEEGDITEINLQQKIIDLKNLYQDHKDSIVAIGECGIDTYYPDTDKFLPLQKKLFVMQCDLARQLALPLMVHIRKDFESAYEILQNYRDLTVYIHCRGFGPEEISRLQALHFSALYIWFCGNISYKNAQNLRDSLHTVPLESLLLETDAPWLSPQIVRGTTNHPANVRYIYEFVADLLSIDQEILAAQIEKNFRTLYNIY